MLIKNLISFKYHEWEIFEGEDFTNGIPARKLGGSRTGVVKLMNLYIIIFRISCIMLQLSMIILKDIKNSTYMKSFEVENRYGDS